MPDKLTDPGLPKLPKTQEEIDDKQAEKDFRRDIAYDRKKDREM